MKKANETRGTAKCASCLFGRPVTVVDKDKSGKETARREMCECHVDAATAERTFAGLVAPGTAVVA